MSAEAVEPLYAIPNHIGHIPPQKQWGMKEHVHPDFHELILVLHGELETRIRGEVLHGQRGDLLLYPAREAHAEQAVGDEPLETLFVGWQGPLPEPPGLPLLVHDRHGRARMLLEWLRQLSPLGAAVESRPVEFFRPAAVLMEALLYEYQQLAQPPEQHLVALVKAHIQHHLAEPLTLDDLAAAAGFSRYHFSREFKRLAGVSPMAYLRQERVAAARSLLLSTPWTLPKIAEQVGFADETQLSRVFRRLMGVPPGKLRK
ncbi:MAG: AraC family transcriptional regulator [Anaerolineae bacterium]|nr:AraC family transcriptional regulator [Anaerolineae bacterium]